MIVWLVFLISWLALKKKKEARLLVLRAAAARRSPKTWRLGTAGSPSGTVYRRPSVFRLFIIVYYCCLLVLYFLVVVCIGRLVCGLWSDFVFEFVASAVARAEAGQRLRFGKKEDTWNRIGQLQAASLLFFACSNVAGDNRFQVFFFSFQNLRLGFFSDCGFERSKID